MKIKLLFLTFFVSFLSNAQTNKIVFQYDQAGNQITRTLCLNCLPTSKKDTKQTAELTAAELLKFSPTDAISYYPNPVKEELYLEWQILEDQKVTSITVYGINGQVVMTYAGIENVNAQNISFQQYSAGIYVLVLHYTSGDQKTIKIIKQ